MNDIHPGLAYTRREFLVNGARGAGLLAFARYAPAFLTQSAFAQVPAPEKDRSILVLIQLAGGNDGLNTLVPFEDSRYYRLRPRLGLKKEECLPIGNNLAFHPSCGALANLYKEGQLSIIQNVGYPNPNRSHFRSSEFWETASDSDEYLDTGWVGRFFDNRCKGAPTGGDPVGDSGGDPVHDPVGDPVGVHVGGQTPQAFLSHEAHNVFGINRRAGRNSPRQRELLGEVVRSPAGGGNAEFLQHTIMDALVTEQRIYDLTNRYQPRVDYPASRLAASLRGVAAMISAGLGTRIYFVSQSGYDTHTNQQGVHARLLTELSDSLAAFQRDLKARRLEDQVLTMTFSEFGRRPNENSGGGTDHGTAAPIFVMGSAVKEPLIGSRPDLKVGPKEDLTYSTDFRQVYSTVIEKWFQCPPEGILSKRFDPLSFI